MKVKIESLEPYKERFRLIAESPMEQMVLDSWFKRALLFSVHDQDQEAGDTIFNWWST